MSDSRKLWTKSVVLGSLEKIEPELKKLEGLAPGAGQMPGPLRKRLITTNSRVRGLIADIRNWYITSGEKAIAEVERLEERVPVRPPEASGERQAKAQAVGSPVTRPPTLSSGPFYLKDGSGPFDTIQQAFDALGLPEGQRPRHNRYERLSKALKEQIARG